MKVYLLIAVKCDTDSHVLFHVDRTHFASNVLQLSHILELIEQ